MSSSSFSSFEVNSSFTHGGKDNDLVLDRAIVGLNKCLQHYEDKAKNSEYFLEKLGLTIKDFPEDLKYDLKEAFKDDDGVFNFARGSSMKMVRINADHVLDSLQEKYELGQLHMLASQMKILVEEYDNHLNNLERKLNYEKDKSDHLENKRYDKEAKLMIFKGKLEAAKRDLDKQLHLSQGSQKPNYSLEEIENLSQEVDKLKIDIAYVNTKLKKYNKLPLSEKDALKQLMKMREELKNVDIELRNKIM